MTTPEQAILERLIARIERLLTSAGTDLELLGNPPQDLVAFDALTDAQQSASRAFLKSFEQIEDQLSRTFRTIPPLTGMDTQRWFGRDYADFMERAGVLDDAADWTRVVKLRNQLVHDYPLDAQVQFDRLIEAIGYLPLVTDAYCRLTKFVREELPGKTI